MRIFFTIALTIALMGCIQPAHAGKERVARVKDGDTFELVAHRTFGFATSIRVFGIDTPEHDYRAKCPEEKAHGLLALTRANELVDGSGGLVWIKVIQRDKFGGRFDAKVKVRSGDKKIDWAQTMISEGFAVPYHGEDKAKVADWCAILAPKVPVNILPLGF